MYEVYRGYIGARGCTKRSRAEHDAKADLIAHAKDNPEMGSCSRSSLPAAESSTHII